ncbi:MAG: OmpA family protein, partial [Nodosilinea sp.]
LLFKSETDRLYDAVHQLEQANQALTQRMGQLQDQIQFLEDQVYDPDRLAVLVCSVIREAIGERVRRDPGAIAGVLGPEMGLAIQEQIVTEREAIVKALSPVIGATVSDYVRDGLQSMLPGGIFRKAGDRASGKNLPLALPGGGSLVEVVPGSAKSSKSWLKKGLVVLLVVGLAGLIYGLLNRPGQRLERAVAQAIDANPELTVYRLSADMQGRTLHLSGRLPNRYLRSQAEQVAKTIAPNYSLANDIIVVESFSQIPTRVYFDLNAAQVKANDIEEKLTLVKQYLQQNPRQRLTITGYALPEETASDTLALQRAQAVQLQLEDLGIDRRRLSATAAEGTPPDVAANEADWLRRTVLFEVATPDLDAPED